ncbi:MAG: hypothetical protein QM690_04565 [Sphingobium sp.]
MRRLTGKPERQADGSWAIGSDHLSNAESYEREKNRRTPIRVEIVDLPPSEWPMDYDSPDHERDDECRARSTSRKRSSASCVKLRLCSPRARQRRRRAVGSLLRSRPTIGGARNMVA